MVTRICGMRRSSIFYGNTVLALLSRKPFRAVPFRLPGTEHAPEKSTVYERMRLALEELGPTFVKFGQIMSTRTEIFSPELITELKKLQDHAKPLPFSEVIGVIRQTCPELKDWFCEIDESPVASASIGQVHRAVLKDGTVVALKVQRPGIPELIENDLAILQSMAERIEGVFPESRMTTDRPRAGFRNPDPKRTGFHPRRTERGEDGSQLPGRSRYPFPEDLLGLFLLPARLSWNMSGG